VFRSFSDKVKIKKRQGKIVLFFFIRFFNSTKVKVWSSPWKKEKQSRNLWRKTRQNKIGQNIGGEKKQSRFLSLKKTFRLQVQTDWLTDCEGAFGI